MISHVCIQNFAIIEDLSVDFDNGLCMITGETGAGKSIIIEAINLALGSRADTSYVRTGEEKARIQLVIETDSRKELDFLRENGIDEPSQLFITREIYVSGKSVCKLNSEMVSVSFLNRICRRLVDIHGQYDHQSLLNPQHHLGLLDAFCACDIQSVKDDVRSCFKAYRDAKSELDSLVTDSEEKQRHFDFLQFELNEINSAELNDGEDDELEERLSRLLNSEKIMNNLSMAFELLTGDSQGGQNPLPASKNLIEEIADFDKPLREFADVLSDCYYRLEDLTGQLRRYRDGVTYSEQEIALTQDRLELINTLKRKYGGSIKSVLAYGRRTASQIETFLNSDERIKELTETLATLETSLLDSSIKLSGLRKKAAEDVKKHMISELGELNFHDACFDIDFRTRPDDDGHPSFSDEGIDEVEFMISTNKGEPLKPLAKIASGGEISRIMLAFKRIIGDYDGIPCVIFDEIDTGISGGFASVVGKKLLDISSCKQVICITHLPQVAAFGKVNYKIEKESKDQRTFVAIKRLNEDEKANELARMLAGTHIGSSALQNAYELMKQSR